MATIAEIKELALHAARGTAPANYSVQNVNDALCDELKALAGDVYSFMKNRYDIYSIMVETIDEIVPKRVIDAIGILLRLRLSVTMKRLPLRLALAAIVRRSSLLVLRLLVSMRLSVLILTPLLLILILSVALAQSIMRECLMVPRLWLRLWIS